MRSSNSPCSTNAASSCVLLSASPGAQCPRTTAHSTGLRTWPDSWTGIGHVAVGMHRQGYDLQLTQYDDRGWRATFYTTGMEHSHDPLALYTKKQVQYGMNQYCWWIGLLGPDPASSQIWNRARRLG